MAHDDVQEAHPTGLVATDGQQGLGLFQAHGGAQPAVELDEGGAGECVQGHVHIHGIVDVLGAGHVLERGDVLFTHAGFGISPFPGFVEVPELVDGDFAHALVAHLCGRKVENVCAHETPSGLGRLAADTGCADRQES